jgi:hypothetical protein
MATFVLPVLEDANSILVAEQIDHKTASLLFYALETASSNLRLTKFEPLSLRRSLRSPRRRRYSPEFKPRERTKTWKKIAEEIAEEEAGFG